jgi:type IV pilus assembly protein PilE
MTRATSRRAARGVTLIELMIAVAIVGILAAIAYPSYQAQVRRGTRTDGKAELLEAAQELEKCYTRYGAYNNAQCASYNQINAATGRLSERGRYRVTFQAVAANTYVLQATLEPGRPADPECGVFTLDQSSQRGSNGTLPLDRCW